ncbi:MAG: hypothetical protein IT305_04150 [Chloroflexi bacterium]|nr:hypothetical protein [Chloroflexota bacterium]
MAGQTYSPYPRTVRRLSPRPVTGRPAPTQRPGGASATPATSPRTTPAPIAAATTLRPAAQKEPVRPAPLAADPAARRWVILGVLGVVTSVLLTLGVSLLGSREVASASPDRRTVEAPRQSRVTLIQQLGGVPRSPTPSAGTIASAPTEGGSTGGTVASAAVRALRRAGRAVVTVDGVRRMALGGAVPFLDGDAAMAQARSHADATPAAATLAAALAVGPAVGPAVEALAEPSDAKAALSLHADVVAEAAPGADEHRGGAFFNLVPRDDRLMLRIIDSAPAAFASPAAEPTARASAVTPTPGARPADVTPTSVPATATRVPPTSVLPTPAPPTPIPATAIPPTATPVPPTAVPPTATTIPPTATSIPATPAPATPIPATATPILPAQIVITPVVVTATPEPTQRPTKTPTPEPTATPWQIVIVVTPTQSPYTSTIPTTGYPPSGNGQPSAPNPVAPLIPAAPSIQWAPTPVPPAANTPVPPPTSAPTQAPAGPARQAEAAPGSTQPRTPAQAAAPRQSGPAPILAESGTRTPLPPRAAQRPPDGAARDDDAAPAPAASPAPAEQPAPREPSAQEKLAVRALTAINTARAQAGALPLGRQATLDMAAWLHAQYDVATGQTEGNFQSPQTPLFVGETPAARVARASGGRGSIERIGEVMALGTAEPEQVVQGWLNSVYHRALVLDLSAQLVGYGQHSAGSATSAVLDLGGRRDVANASGWFPASGATDVPTRCVCDDYAEASGNNGSFGYPITLLLGTIRPTGLPTTAQLTVGGEDGRPVAAALVDAFGNPTLVPREPLEPGTRYTVRMAWTNGPSVAWSFTTRAQ